MHLSMNIQTELAIAVTTVVKLLPPAGAGTGEEGSVEFGTP